MRPSKKYKKRVVPVVMAEEDFLYQLMEQGILKQLPTKKENPSDLNQNKYKLDEVIVKYETNC